MAANTASRNKYPPLLFKQIPAILSLIVATLCCAGAQGASPGMAQAWPTKPVRVLVPFGAGGTPDLLARILAEKLATYNGQAFVIDNRPGAGGSIGAGIVAHANPDGYHLLMTPGSVLTMSPSLYAQMPFDDASFAPVSLVAEMATLLIVNPRNPAKNISEFISAARRDPGKLLFSSPGAGSSLHLAIELFNRTAGVAIQHIPYKSGGEAVTAVLSGQTTGTFANPPLVIPHIKAGTLRALGVAGSARLPQLPDVPATSEAGVAGFDMTAWFGLVAPSKTPRPLVGQLSAQIASALREPDVQQRLAELGVRVIGSNPDEFADYLRKERAKWSDIIRTANIRID